MLNTVYPEKSYILSSLFRIQTEGKDYRQTTLAVNVVEFTILIKSKTGLFLLHCVCQGSTLYEVKLRKHILSYDVAYRSEITPCNKLDKPLLVYRFSGSVMTSITTLRT